MWHVCVTSSARNIFSSGAAIPQGDCTEESACELLILITPWMQPSNWLKVTGIDRQHNLGQKVSTMQHNLFSDLKIIRPVLRRLPLSAGCKVWIDTSHFDTNSSSQRLHKILYTLSLVCGWTRKIIENQQVRAKIRCGFKLKCLS